MIACLLDAGGLDPTVVNGGIINAYGANAKVGDGDWIVVEADESGRLLPAPEVHCGRRPPTSTPSTWITTGSSRR